MDDFVKSFGKYSEDLILECDAYSQKLAAKKAAAQRRRQTRNLRMRIAASATVMIVIVSVIIGGLIRQDNLKNVGQEYTRYESFQEALDVIEEETLLSRMPAAETESVDIYDSTLSDSASWADVICRGRSKEYSVDLEISFAQRNTPRLENALYLDLVPNTQVQTKMFGLTSVQYAAFEKGDIVQNSSTFVAVFLYENTFYRFQYVTENDKDVTSLEALSYLENLLVPIEA